MSDDYLNDKAPHRHSVVPVTYTKETAIERLQAVRLMLLEVKKTLPRDSNEWRRVNDSMHEVLRAISEIELGWKQPESGEDELALACDTLRQQLEWRDARKELPEEGDIVLVRGSHVYPVRAMYEAGKWWCCEDEDPDWLTGITHWLPIPEHKEGE